MGTENPSLRSADLLTEIQPSVAVTASDVGAAFRLPDGLFKGILFTLNLTAAAAASGDTLDVVVETKNGGVWIQVCHFTQRLGTASALKESAKILAEGAQAMVDPAAALGAAAVRHIFGDEWRVRWTIAGSTPAFTFSVDALPM